MLCYLLKAPGRLKRRPFQPFRTQTEAASGPRIAEQVKQPRTAVDYGEANGQANQHYDWAPEKEFLNHGSGQALVRLLAGFPGLSSLGYGIFIYS